ncbi:MAG: class I SAM-dependent RNA methyltransferase [Candidatus Omnitrophica bacterium]|nr:class I SAM-dependent RNA methyltransferase [Candidatus Omnitrophota bacterium]
MQSLEEKEARKVTPLCPVFGRCGGCEYQDLSYEDELSRKEQALRRLFSEADLLETSIFEPIVVSPEPYHYRHRLDLAVRKRRDGTFLMGFNPPGSRDVIEIDQCPIARKEVSDFIPELRRQAREKIPEKYRTANLVVKTGDDGRVHWGGIGRRSLRMEEKDFFWTEIDGRRIHYSLETFFQANLSILSALTRAVIDFGGLDEETHFLDLYSGVGLFGLCVMDHVKKVSMIEEGYESIRLAQYNVAYHQAESKVQIMKGRTEDLLAGLLLENRARRTVAMIDPPRKGLAASVLETLMYYGKAGRGIEKLFYLSCYPPSLIRDLKGLTQAGWHLEKIIPFDLFPKTKHLETLVLMTSRG